MIEIKTILNEKQMLTFNKSQSIKLIWFPFVLTALLAGLGIVYLVRGDEKAYGISMIVLGALMPFLFLWVTNFLMKKTIKKSPVLNGGTTQIFRFTDERVMLNESSKYIAASDTELTYDAFIRAEEKPTAYYMFIGKSQAYILDNKGFTSGSREELNALLSEKMGARFKPLGKRK